MIQSREIFTKTCHSMGFTMNYKEKTKCSNYTENYRVNNTIFKKVLCEMSQPEKDPYDMKRPHAL